jgi:hypothetical protein
MTKPLLRHEARELRGRSGLPIKVIAQRLGVSPSTVSLWVRDLPEHGELIAANRHRQGLAMGKARAAQSRALRETYQQAGRARARDDDALHRAGCMLYWAEGAKARNTFKFSNSDLHMVRLMRHFLATEFGLPPERFVITLNVYTNNGLTISQIEEHWLSALSFPRTCLRKHTLNHHPTSTSGRKRNRLPYGVCSLVVHSTEVIQHIFGAIQQYGGFDEPAWRDIPRTGRLRPQAPGT